MARARRQEVPPAPPAQTPGVRYEWRDKPLTILNAKRANPQRIGEELARIAANHGGRLKRRDALAAAENPRSPLHRHLIWDDQEAATRYRLDQIGEIIRLIAAVEITADRGEVRGPAFVNINEGGKLGHSYRPLSAVFDNLDVQLAVMKQAERDLAAWERRYTELTDLCDLVRQARETLADRRAAIERRGLDARH